MMTKRKRMLKPPSLSCLAENAKIGTVKASPTRTVTGRHRSTHQDGNAPNAADTAMKIVVAPAIWAPT